MTTNLPEPERWADRADAGATAEDLLGTALRGARAATAPAEAFLARLEAGGAHDVRVALGPPRWGIAFAVVAVTLALGGTVGATRGRLRGWAVRHGLVAADAPAPSANERPRWVARVAVPAARVESLDVPPPLEAPPAPAPAVVPAPSVASAPPTFVPRIAPRSQARGVELGTAAAESPPPPPAAAEEARLLGGVFRGLRSEAADGTAALAALDDYDRRFPSGVLRVEARRARVEALLQLDRRADALALLDAWEGGGAGLTRDARAARGELRAEAGRCDQAAADFAAVLATSADDVLGGRALYGRASCALRAGDDATAAAALTRYLKGHPDGPHAAAARDALARLAAP